MEYLNLIEKKIIKSKEELNCILSEWRFHNEKIVFTNGCFDVLHYGHIEYLAKAASIGSKLILGVNTDASVKKLKGEKRPINSEKARALTLAALVFVDKVVFFEEDTPLELIRQVQPDVLVKGGDYRPEEIVGYEVVKAKGGEILTLDFVKGYSTTEILEKI